jgi:hypothetical protein
MISPVTTSELLVIGKEICQTDELGSIEWSNSGRALLNGQIVAGTSQKLTFCHEFEAILIGAV